MEVITIRSLKGKIVVAGKHDGFWFYKGINFSKHHFRKADALGLDLKTLGAITSNHLVRIVLRDKESGKRYETTVERFLEKGWVYPKKGDTHYGRFQPQHFLALERWSIYDAQGNLIQQGEQTEEERIRRDKHEQERVQRERVRDAAYLASLR